MEFKIANKTFRTCDFENEFTLRQSKPATILYIKYVETLQSMNPKLFTDLTDDKVNNKKVLSAIGEFANKLDYGLYAQIIAVSCFEKTKSGFEYIDENLEANAELIYKHLTPKLFKELEGVIQDFFTYSSGFMVDGFQMHSAVLTKITKPTP